MRQLIAPLALPTIALALTACSGGATPAMTPEATNAPAATVAPATTDAAPTAGATTDAAAPADAEASNAAALRAITFAAGEAGGTAYGLDDSDLTGTWEVDVLVGDRSHEIEVSEDGTTVEGREEEDADRDDIDRLGRAQVTIEDAIDTALAEVPGTLDDVELDDEDGTDVWEVTIDAADNDDIEVYVDAGSGEILRVDR